MSVTPDTPAVTVPAPVIPAPRVAIHETHDTAPTPVVPAVPVEPTPPATPVAVDLCVCGHGRDAHEHYRPGTDCGACGSTCRAFHARTGRAAGRSARHAARLTARLFRRS